MGSTNDQRRRVAITGIGVINPLGNTAAAMADKLFAGQSGVKPLTVIPPLQGKVIYGGEADQFTGAIDDFGDLEKSVKKMIRKALKMMCRESMMAVAAAQQAIADARLKEQSIDPERSGVVFGSDYMLSLPDDYADGMIECGAAEGDFQYDRWGSAGLKQMNPLWMLKYLPNMPASHIAIFNDLRGPNNSLTMHDASGLLSIREAAQTIARGHADVMLAGATGTRIHPFKSVHAVQQFELADPEAEPEQASRPFDAQRTGMVVGEGAGALMLEELEAARRRGARIYGEVRGTGSSIAASKEVNGSLSQAMAAAVRGALNRALCRPEKLGHVNAHGMATRACDAAEAKALQVALGEVASSIPVVAAKSYFGNLGAAGCVVELAASLHALDRGRLFRTLNYSTPDPECPLSVNTDDARPSGDSFLKLSVTPQAQAAAVVISRCE